MSDLQALILAAGKGTRMKSGLPKVLHRLAGRPMIRFVVDTALACGARRVVMVVGHEAGQVKEAVRDLPVEFVTQEQQLGTGHAVMAARDAISDGPGQLLILSGDVPLLEAGTVTRLAGQQTETGAGCTLLTTRLDNPTGYGRIITGSSGLVERIVEEADADPDQRQVRVINAGIYCFRTDLLFQTLSRCGSDNAQGEYYLTDAIAAIRGEGHAVQALEVDDPDQVAGINTRLELARMGSILNRRKLDRLMLSGVTVVSPETTQVHWDVEVGPETTVHSHSSLEGKTRIGTGCTIQGFTRLVDATLGDGATVREFSVLRGCHLAPGSETGPHASYGPDDSTA
jgi:bifunctional UDP-N-acetylglucosamine pyrophosphorylase/glucosamine-1-phosphate N-acetyltransferase